MNLEPPSFADWFARPYIQLQSSASPQCRVQFTKATWLGIGFLAGRGLDEAIRDCAFSFSYYGLYTGTGPNILFNNVMYENIKGAYFYGGGEVANCTFDRNETGLEGSAGAEQTLHVRDCLFSENLDYGLDISDSPDRVLNYYNAFWDNGTPVSGGSPGNGSQLLTESPYETDAANDWQNRYRLDQDSPVVDGGSITAGDAGLAAYTTASDNRYDTRYVDMGSHFLARSTIWVDGDYGGEYGDSDGSRLKPYEIIGDALSSAAADTTVVVLPGTYLYDIHGQEQQVTAVSSAHLVGSGSRATILDGQRMRNDTYPFVSWPLVKIDGKSDVTVAAITISGRFNEEWEQGKSGGLGGGLMCKDSTGIVIRDCLVTYNDADYGGGLYITNSNVTTENCTIHQNKAISGIAGGGIYIASCASPERTVTIRRCVISNNAAAAPAEDSLGGGGLFCTSGSDPLIEDCIVSYNRAAGGHGAGIYLDTNCSAVIRNCIIECNVARHNTYYESPDYPECGGGIYIKNCSPTVSGCTISNNGSVWRGAGISCYGDSCVARIVNCTVVYNKDRLDDEYETAGIWSDGAHPSIVNCIIWGNDDDLAGGTPSGMATYSCVEDTGQENEGEGNIHANPCLVGSVYGPYHLGYVSPPEGNPCVGTGTTDPAKLPPGYQFPEFDLDGDNRRVQVGEDEWIVDMGSDQRHPFREVVGIRRDYPQNKIVITWASESGKSYGVYRSTDPFGNYMSWQHQTDVVAQGDLAAWEDTSINFETEHQRYYKVLDNNGKYCGTWTRPVGFVNPLVQDIGQERYESTFFAIPLEPMYQTINAAEGAYNENLARMVAGYEGLTGEYLEEGDEMEFVRLGYPDTLEAPSSDFVDLQLHWNSGQPEWLTTGQNPVEPEDRFVPGRVFRIIDAGGMRTGISFVGHVPCGLVGFVPFRTLWGRYCCAEFGYPYPVQLTLHDIPFLEHGAIGEPDEQGPIPDHTYTPSPDGHPQSQELWLKDDPAGESGVWYHGTNRAGSPLCDVAPGKGFQYVGRQADPEGSDGLDYIYNNIYWRRVPVTRPYHFE